MNILSKASEMTRRERVVHAIRHEETEIVPHQIDFTGEEYDKLVRETGDADFGNTVRNHILFSGIGSFSELPGRRGFFADDFGVVWNRTRDRDIGVVDRVLIDDPENDRYVFPELQEAKVRADVERAIAWGKKSGQFVVFDIGFSMFERAWALRGMENLLIDFVENPEFVHGLMDRICAYHCRAVEIAAGYPEVDAVMFGDDWGQQRGLIMGEKYWREFIKPYVARMYACAKKREKFVIQHSCGDIESIFPDLIGMGLDVYQTFQPEIYDVERVKREFGEKLAFWGGISTQTLLPFADAETVERETRRIMDVMKTGGGYIASPTHGMPRDIPTANVLAMLGVFLEQYQKFRFDGASK